MFLEKFSQKKNPFLTEGKYSLIQNVKMAEVFAYVEVGNFPGSDVTNGLTEFYILLTVHHAIILGK